MRTARQSSANCSDNICRVQLQENALLKKYYCDVNINDLINYNEELAHKLVTEPADIIPLVCFVQIPKTNSSHTVVHSLKALSRNAHTASSSPTNKRSTCRSTSFCSTPLPKMSPSGTSIP